MTASVPQTSRLARSASPMSASSPLVWKAKPIGSLSSSAYSGLPHTVTVSPSSETAVTVTRAIGMLGDLQGDETCWCHRYWTAHDACDVRGACSCGSWCYTLLVDGSPPFSTLGRDSSRRPLCPSQAEPVIPLPVTTATFGSSMGGHDEHPTVGPFEHCHRQGSEDAFRSRCRQARLRVHVPVTWAGSRSPSCRAYRLSIRSWQAQVPWDAASR